MEIHVQDLREGYKTVIDTVLQEGSHTSPRGLGTTELTGVTIRVEEPRLTLPVGINRGVVPALGYAEALQTVGGFQAPATMVKLTNTFERFMVGEALDDSGAYGCRLRGQLPLIQQILQTDPDSRQALAMIWDPLRDLHEEGTHRSCTVFLQFFIRQGKLEMHTVMRSNDAWWGLAYDAFQFASVQMTMADALGIEVGQYVHHAMSLHLYDTNLEAARRLTLPSFSSRNAHLCRSFWMGSWKDTREGCLDALLRPAGGVFPEGMLPSASLRDAREVVLGRLRDHPDA